MSGEWRVKSEVMVSLRDYFKTIPEGDTTTPLSTLNTPLSKEGIPHRGKKRKDDY